MENQTVFRNLALTILIALNSVLLDFGSIAQSDEFSAKNQFYLYWGYNRSAYTKSDLTCVGRGYNFTMNDLEASDNPERFTPKVYFNPKKSLSLSLTFEWVIFLMTTGE